MINLNILDAEVLNKLQFEIDTRWKWFLYKCSFVSKVLPKMVDLKSHGSLTLQSHGIPTKVVMSLCLSKVL